MHFSFYVVNLPLAYGEDIDAVAALARGDRRGDAGGGRLQAVHPGAARGDRRGRVRGERRPAQGADQDGAAETVVRRPRAPAAHQEAMAERGIHMFSPQRTVAVPPPRLSVARRRSRRLLAPRLLDDLDAGAGADAGRAGRHHRFQSFVVTHAAGRLDAHVGADDAAHQRDVGRGRAAGGKARRRLDEIGARRLRQRAGRDLLVVGQQRGFDDHLADDAGLMARPRTTAAMSRSTTWRSPDFSAPILITMSISARRRRSPGGSRSA